MINYNLLYCILLVWIFCVEITWLINFLGCVPDANRKWWPKQKCSFCSSKNFLWTSTQVWLLYCKRELESHYFMAKIMASSRFKLKSFPNTLCCRKYPEDDVIMDEAIIFPFCRCNKQVITCCKGTTCLSGTDWCFLFTLNMFLYHSVYYLWAFVMLLYPSFLSLVG